jgi:hypothetical protein
MTRQRLGISEEEQSWLVDGFSLGRPDSFLRLVHLAYVRFEVTDQFYGNTWAGIAQSV